MKFNNYTLLFNHLMSSINLSKIMNTCKLYFYSNSKTIIKKQIIKNVLRYSLKNI